MVNKITPEQIREEDGLEPGGYTYAWFCNIKMPIYNELLKYEKYLTGVLDREKLDKTSANVANHLMAHLFRIHTNFE